MYRPPYNTPNALKKEPWTAAFWVIVAPFLFPVVALSVTGFFYPIFEVIDDPDATREGVRVLWLASCLGGVLHFAALSFWAQRIGAGAFLGKMNGSARWVVAAVLLGPGILLAPNIAASMIMAEHENWQYAAEVNTALFARENLSLSYLLFGIVVAPLVEEMTFRGLAMGAVLSQGGSAAAALVLSSFAFTLLHIQYSPAAMVVVFLSGFGFGVLRLLSGTIIVPILAHVAANASVFFIAFAAGS